MTPLIPPRRTRWVPVALAFLCAACPDKKDGQPTPASSKTPDKAAAPPVDASKKNGPGAPAPYKYAPKLAPDKGPPLPPLPPAKELKFDVRNGSLWVSSKDLSTSLSERADSVDKTVVSGDSITVAYKDQISCAIDEELKKDVAYFQARLENTRAFRLYQEKNFAEAARGFRRASELDDHYDKARTNFIAALGRAGDVKTAAIALTHALARDPITTYAKLLSDEDFAPLRKDFRTKNTAKKFLRLEGNTLAPFAGYTKDRDLIAVVRTEVSWGAENWMAELHVFDAKTKKQVSQHSLVSWHDTREDGGFHAPRKKALDERLAHINEALTAFDFEELPDDVRGKFEQKADRPVVEAPLPQLQLSVVGENDTFRLVRGDDVLATFHSKLEGARPAFVYPFPTMNALVYVGHYEVAEGCDSGPEGHLEVFLTDKLVGPSE